MNKQTKTPQSTYKQQEVWGGGGEGSRVNRVQSQTVATNSSLSIIINKCEYTIHPLVKRQRLSDQTDKTEPNKT